MESTFIRWTPYCSFFLLPLGEGRDGVFDLNLCCVSTLGFLTPPKSSPRGGLSRITIT